MVSVYRSYVRFLHVEIKQEFLCILYVCIGLLVSVKVINFMHVCLCIGQVVTVRNRPDPVSRELLYLSFFPGTSALPLNAFKRVNSFSSGM